MPKIFFYFGKPAQKGPFSTAYDYLSHDEVLKMFDFLKKRRETEQQRKIKRVLELRKLFWLCMRRPRRSLCRRNSTPLLKVLSKDGAMSESDLE
ncbi:hypothetical protein [Pseudomonas sp. PB3P13]